MRSWPRRLDARWIVAALLCLAAPAAFAEGLIGIFFDSNGQECSGSAAAGAPVTLYVLLVPSGSTYAGITGVEFRVDASGASNYLLSNEAQPSGAIKLGSALGGGCNVAFSTCQTGSVTVLTFQVMNAGSGSADGTLRITAKTDPSNPNFACPLAVLCDAPTYTELCVDTGLALLNPSGSRSCTGGRVPAKWSGVKQLYRP